MWSMKDLVVFVTRIWLFIHAVNIWLGLLIERNEFDLKIKFNKNESWFMIYDYIAIGEMIVPFVHNTKIGLLSLGLWL